MCEVLALLFLLHRENGDFSFLMKDICVGLLMEVTEHLFPELDVMKCIKQEIHLLGTSLGNENKLLWLIEEWPYQVCGYLSCTN